jgi:hypothetical protein
MYKYNRFASAVLSRVEFDFGNYSEIAGRAAEICLRLDEDFTEKLRREEVRSQRSYVLALTLKSAVEYCRRENIDAATDTCTELFFNDVYDFIMDLTFALTEYDPEWRRDQDETKINKLFYLRLPVSEYSRLETYLVNENVYHNSKDLERIIADYLSSKVRSDELDSLMFKLLAEEEPVQFIYAVAHKSPFVSDLVRPQLEIAKENIKAFETSVFKNAVIGLLRYSLYSIIIFATAFLAEFAFFTGELWPFYIALGLCAIMMVLWLLGLIWFVSAKNKFLRTRAENKDIRLINLVHAMSNFFQMLRSTGKVSLDRIETKLNELEDMGAVMPETLHVFIKDLRLKGKTSI